MKFPAFTLGSALCVPISLLASSTAYANEPADINRWASATYSMQYKGEAFSDRRKNAIDTGEILYTTSETNPGLLFTCLAGKFRVAVSLKPQNMATAFSSTKTYGVSGNGSFVPAEKMLSYVDMTLDDGPKIGLGRWLYFKDREAAKSRKRVPAAKLYNAIVKNQTITIHTKRKQALLDLPRPNAAFADFGAACGLGRNAEKK